MLEGRSKIIYSVAVAVAVAVADARNAARRYGLWWTLAPPKARE
ncbi:hypothetical protein [Streptomyces tanashiensis]|nr:hypothetical protein [Streptomyces tanashiensis]